MGQGAMRRPDPARDPLLDPDIVLLQEVGWGRDEDYERVPAVHGYASTVPAYSHRVHREVPSAMITCFLRGLTRAAATYRVDWLDDRWSDHDPLVVEVGPKTPAP